MAYVAKSSTVAFQRGALGSVGTRPNHDPKPMLEHVFSFLGRMRERNVVPIPRYESMPRWIRRLSHTPYAAIAGIDLRFLKAAVHCDGYLNLVHDCVIDYGRLSNRPSKQACINLLYRTISVINGENPVWYAHRKPDKDEHNEYVLELNANLTFNEILFEEEAPHLGPLHLELPKRIPGDPGLTLNDKRYLTTAEANEHRKKLRYTPKQFDGVIPDVSHPRYLALSRKHEDQKIFDSLIKPLFQRLMRERKEFLLSGYPVGKAPDNFDEVIRGGVPHAFAGKFYSVELLHRYRRYLGSMNNEELPETVPSAAAPGRGMGGFLLTHMRSKTKFSPTTLVETLKASGVSLQFIGDFLFAIKARDIVRRNLCPSITEPSIVAQYLPDVFDIGKKHPGYSWMHCVADLSDRYASLSNVDLPTYSEDVNSQFQYVVLTLVSPPFVVGPS